MRTQPTNVLLLVTDQERAAGPYEPPGMRRFRAQHLPTRQRLFREGVRFTQHRIASSACVPSRAVMFTGYRADITGVATTDGLAKRHDDHNFQWLDPTHVPTLGHRLAAAGFETPFIGKWHLSHPTLRGDNPYTRDPSVWLAQDLLQPWGFSNWVGPEPHGPRFANSGLRRDPEFIAQATRWLRDRAARGPDAPPFVMVVSLVNPHDQVFWPIVHLFWPLLRHVFPQLLDLDGIPDIGPARSESPETYGQPGEPSALTAYRERYPAAYGHPQLVSWLYRTHPERYRRFYASLIRRADRHMRQLLNVLEETGLDRSTSVVWTADHGDMLGAHGLHQKWYNAFEETVRVPLVIRTPDRARAGEAVSTLTSHVDLVPTILGLAGVSPELSDADASAFTSTPPLEGVDVMAGLSADRASYFETRDHVLEGPHREAATARFVWGPLRKRLPFRYPPMASRHTTVEALVRRDQDGTLWKLVRYRPEDDDALRTHGAVDADEWSLFCLDTDPCELHDRYADATLSDWRETLRRDLRERATACG